MRRLGYVPALDGLRAIAISAVVVAHAFAWPSNGNGALGVDLFFVLSGFLITHLLLEEHADSGRVSIRRFYGRRGRRLLPALLALLAVYAIVSIAAGSNPSLPAAAGAFYFTNLLNGLSAHHNGMPLAHLWSLAEEEQFYMVWPVVLLAGLRFAPRRIVGLLLAVTVALAIHRQILVSDGASGYRVLYMPDTRSDGLLVGAAFAVWHFRDPGRLARACRITAIAGLPIFAFLYARATVPLLVTPFFPIVMAYFGAVVYAAANNEANVRALESKPLVYLGGVSYALYLWHVPILWVAGPLRGERVNVFVTLAAVAMSLLMAHLSTTYLERRFRRHRAHQLETANSTAINGDVAAGGEGLIASVAVAPCADPDSLAGNGIEPLLPSTVTALSARTASTLP